MIWFWIRVYLPAGAGDDDRADRRLRGHRPRLPPDPAAVLAHLRHRPAHGRSSRRSPARSSPCRSPSSGRSRASRSPTRGTPCSSSSSSTRSARCSSAAFVAPFTRGGGVAAVPRPADAQGGVRRRADDAGGDHRLVSLLLRLLTAEPPLDPSGDEARSLLRRELVHPEYHERNVFQQLLDWLDRLVGGRSTARRRRAAAVDLRRDRRVPAARPGARLAALPGAAYGPRGRRPAGPVARGRHRHRRRAAVGGRARARRGAPRRGPGRRLPRPDGAPGRARPARRPPRAPRRTRSRAPSPSTYPDQRRPGRRQRRPLRRRPVRRPAGDPRPGGRRPGARRRAGGSPMSAPTARRRSGRTTR